VTRAGQDHANLPGDEPAGLNAEDRIAGADALDGPLGPVGHEHARSNRHTIARRVPRSRLALQPPARMFHAQVPAFVL
jgi:hypothetical protein